MAFVKQGYGWALLVGLGLVLLAVLTWIVQVQPAESAAVPQRQLVQEAVNDLSSCLTCHSKTASEAQLAVYRFPQRHADDLLNAGEQTIPVVSDLQARLDDQLAEAGQRILELPETDAPDYHNMINEYLRIYRSSRGNTDQQVLLSALDHLTRLEQLVKVLEHQASPYKWNVESFGQPIAPRTAALSTLSPLTFAALYHQTFLLNLVPEECSDWEEVAILAPERVFFAAYRRGPPANELLFESV